MPPSRREALLALALLASAPLVFGLFMRSAFPPQCPWEWMIAIPMFWPMVATFLSRRSSDVRFDRCLRRPSARSSDLWHGLCRTGVWGCPVG